jgi:hypothetical protein
MAKKLPKKVFSKEPGLTLFPGPKYEVKRGVMSLATLKQEAQALAAQLGPDNPRVRMMRKEIADREKDRNR